MFKIGDKVKIRKDSKYYDRVEPSNPKDTIGTICQLYETHSYNYQVKWPAGAKNAYNDFDLELADTVQISYPIY